MSRLSQLLKLKVRLVDGVTKEICKALNKTMWDAFDLHRSNVKLAECIAALVGVMALLGGRQGFARIVAAAIRDPDVDPTAKAKLLAAVIRMQLVVDAEQKNADSAINLMSDEDLQNELIHLTKEVKERRANKHFRDKIRAIPKLRQKRYQKKKVQ